MKILIVADIKSNKLNRNCKKLVSKANQLGAETAVVCIGSQLSAFCSELVDLGTTTQFVCEDASLEWFSPQAFASCIVDAAQKFEPSHIWFSSGENSKVLGPTIATKMKTACINDIIAIEVKGDDYIAIRPSYAGKVMQTLKSSKQPIVSIFRDGTFDTAENVPGTENRIALEVPQADLRTIIKEVIKEASDDIDITEAEIVISMGRGVKDQEGINMVRDFAKGINAGVGASRALVDNGLMPHNSQVGQTGKIVAPKLYIALGISGAIQHVAGMAGSNWIVAVNRDPEAPIFNVANYGIVGDLYQALPILREEIAKLRAA